MSKKEPTPAKPAAEIAPTAPATMCFVDGTGRRQIVKEGAPIPAHLIGIYNETLDAQRAAPSRENTPSTMK